MADKRTADQIESSLRSTRRQLDEDLEELRLRLRGLRNTVPSWLLGIGGAATLFLARKRLARAAGTLLPLGVPLLLPWVIGRLRDHGNP